ncbi:hypothetical protein ACFL2X_01270 [Candidatus Latescibacterota bacterium]
MKRTVCIICLLSLMSFAFSPAVSAQINLSALTTLGYTGLDSDSNINTMHRHDDPFDPLRISLFMDSQISPEISVFLEFLWDAGIPPTGGGTKPRINGAYAVLSPFQTETVNFKVGYIPLPFGTWAPRTYADRNPLIGVPLFQHYITSLKGGELALSTDDLKTWRDSGNGFLTVAYDACWPYGVEAFGFFSKYEYSIAVTKETMSNPGAYMNDGVQYVGRFGARPVIGLRLGVSAEYGSYLGADSAGLPSGTKLEDVFQKAVGFDIHYSIAHTRIYSEFIRNLWENPNLSDDIGCTSWYAEVQQIILPGFYGAVRFDQMLFDSFEDSSGKSFNWDNNINRTEAGFGYFLNKDAQIKLVWQHNAIDDNKDVDLLSTQLVLKM